MFVAYEHGAFPLDCEFEDGKGVFVGVWLSRCHVYVHIDVDICTFEREVNDGLDVKRNTNRKLSDICHTILIKEGKLGIMRSVRCEDKTPEGAETKGMSNYMININCIEIMRTIRSLERQNIETFGDIDQLSNATLNLEKSACRQLKD